MRGDEIKDERVTHSSFLMEGRSVISVSENGDGMILGRDIGDSEVVPVLGTDGKRLDDDDDEISL